MTLPAPWRILITGTPGTGKTALAKSLAKPLHATVIAEKTLASKKGVGERDPTTTELEVDLPALKREINQVFTKTDSNIILEGHLSAEFSLNVNGVIVLTCPLPELEKRLRARKYSEVKIQDNLFCEEEGYVREHVKKHYPRIPRLELPTHRPKKVIRASVVNWIRKQIRIAGGSSRESHSHSTRTRARRRNRR